MRQIRFKKIIMEGFGSFAEKTSFELDRGGVNLIKGENGNGKTTMFSALSWCLYKVNLKDTVNEKVATWDYLRPAAWKGTRVALFFDIDGDAQYMVSRHLDFKGNTLGLKAGSKLMIFRKEDENRPFVVEDLVGDAQHKADMQVYINRLMGVDSKAFLNSVLFGQRMKRLIESENKDKRELFESLFDVDFVEDCKVKAKDRYTEAQTKIRTNNAAADAEQAVVTAKKEEIERGEEILKTFENDKKGRIETLAFEKLEVSTKLDAAVKEEKKQKGLAALYTASKEQDLRSALDLFEGAEKSIRGIYEEHEDALKSSTKSLNNAVDKLAEQKQALLDMVTDCPTCKAPLDEKEIVAAKKVMQKAILAEELVIKELTKVKTKNEAAEKSNKTQLTLAESNVTKAQEELDKYVASVADYKKAYDSLHLYVEKVTDLNDQITKLDEKIEKEKATKPPELDLEKLRKDVVDSETKIEQLDVESEKEQKESERLDWWIKKGFGSGGLKAFVFNAMLNQLNIYLETYASRLGVGVKFSIDLTKDSKPFVTTCYIGEHTVDYAELSGGQKQRIDVCIAFAMHDVVDNLNKFNILILDEVFEGLDEKGIKAIFDLIRLKAAGKRTVYVVTHSTMIDGLQAKHINIEYENKLSYIR